LNERLICTIRVLAERESDDCVMQNKSEQDEVDGMDLKADSGDEVRHIEKMRYTCFVSCKDKRMDTQSHAVL